MGKSIGITTIMNSGTTSKPVGTALVTLTIALLWLSPSPVEATCPQWDVSGKWEIEQENPTAHVELDVTQSGTAVTGTAKLDGAEGKVKGTVVGNDFSLEISQGNGKRAFNGTIGPGGVAGVYTAPGASRPTVWYSTSAMKCVDAAPGIQVGAIDPNRPQSAESISLATATSPTQTSAAAGKIFANPHYPTVAAGQAEGITTLTWDGGQDHPNAEVWVKIDDEKEKLVVKQAKGSRQERLKPNKLYFYILLDAGQQLDSVTVTAVN